MGSLIAGEFQTEERKVLVIRAVGEEVEIESVHALNWGKVEAEHKSACKGMGVGMIWN